MRTITDPDDLDTLPVNTVLVDPGGRISIKVLSGWGGREVFWCYAGTEYEETPALPATVAYNPEEEA